MTLGSSEECINVLRTSNIEFSILMKNTYVRMCTVVAMFQCANFRIIGILIFVYDKIFEYRIVMVNALHFIFHAVEHMYAKEAQKKG